MVTHVHVTTLGNSDDIQLLNVTENSNIILITFFYKDTQCFSSEQWCTRQGNVMPYFLWRVCGISKFYKIDVFTWILNNLTTLSFFFFFACINGQSTLEKGLVNFTFSLVQRKLKLVLQNHYRLSNWIGSIQLIIYNWKFDFS
jgi:hypothetical protein